MNIEPGISYNVLAKRKLIMHAKHTVISIQLGQPNSESS